MTEVAKLMGNNVSVAEIHYADLKTANVKVGF